MILKTFRLFQYSTVCADCCKRNATTTATGALLPEPNKSTLPLTKVFLSVISGILIGAAISKYMANFLEEHDLFVPSDDDDDD